MDAMLPVKWCAALCYPSPTRGCCIKRLTELRLLGVLELLEEGSARIGDALVIGKGTSAIAIKAVYCDGSVVLAKVRRLDSRRDSLLGEAAALAIANSVGVGPRLIACSRNVLVREYVKGVPFAEFALRNCGELLREVFTNLVLQLAALDSVGLVHNELARFEDHVLVEESSLRPMIIDFESATLNRSRSNVTQLLSFLMKKGGAAQTLRECLGISLPAETLRGILREYKSERNIGKLLVELGLCAR